MNITRNPIKHTETCPKPLMFICLYKQRCTNHPWSSERRKELQSYGMLITFLLVWKMCPDWVPGMTFKCAIRSDQSLSRVQLFETPWIAALQVSLSITNSQNSFKLMCQWCHPAISSSVVPFSSRPQSLPASESFPMSQLFAWGGQSTAVSASASFLPKKSQGWSPSEWTGWISLQSKGLSRVFSNTTVQKNQFFGAQLSSWSNSHIHT